MTNTTGTNTETVVRGIPVVNKTAISTNSQTTTTTSTTGVGTSDINLGVVVKSTTNNAGTTNSVGVAGEAGAGSSSVKGDITIDVKPKQQ